MDQNEQLRGRECLESTGAKYNLSLACTHQLITNVAQLGFEPRGASWKGPRTATSLSFIKVYLTFLALRCRLWIQKEEEFFYEEFAPERFEFNLTLELKTQATFRHCDRHFDDESSI